MFPNPHHQTPPFSQPLPHSFPVAATPPPHDFSATANVDSSVAPSPPPHAVVLQEPASGGDGDSIEVPRRSRGRPPGSKNKPKPPPAAVDNAGPTMSCYVLEVSGGSDIIEAISGFCRLKNTGLCIMNAHGTIADVTLRQASSSQPSIVTFNGRYDILHVCATFVPYPTSFHIPNGFAITLAGPRGQIFGGLVAGELISAGTVYIVAASFNNPFHHRLPTEDEVRKLGFTDGRSPPISAGKYSQNAAAAAAGTCGLLPMYSTQSSSEGMWTMAARKPPPPAHHRQY